jgi:hypothetical protein
VHCALRGLINSVLLVLPLAALVALLLPVAAQPPPSSAAADEETARTVCVTCHRLPPPDVLPRGAWNDEIQRMARIRENREVPPGQAAPPIELAPDMQAALRFYEAHAPEALAAPDAWPAVAPRPAFERRPLTPPGAPPAPGISNVELLDVDGDARPELIVCDMRHGMVWLARPYHAMGGLSLVARLAHPDHAAAVDLNRDGTRDLLIADLGEFLPGDHDKGGFSWLRGLPAGGFSRFGIGRMPRVADVETADMDGDGDLDLLVAAFGYRKTGQLLLLENRTTDWAAPAFAPHTIDPRPGAIHVLPVDLNQDGRLDVVALLAQEHEQVIAYINTGPLTFTPQVIYAAPHPNWGSSGIELADLDGDGDPDVLLAHGDTFDDSLLKPYHGIEWLENRGAYPFAEHTLARMPGAHRARAVDLDGDGDLDVVASAFVADGGGEAAARLPSLVWLEQVRKGVFERRTLETGALHHPTLAVGDVNADGKADIVVGNMATAGAVEAWVEIWVQKDGR